MDNIATTFAIVTRDRALFAASCRPTGLTGSTDFGKQDKHTLLDLAPPMQGSP